MVRLILLYYYINNNDNILFSTFLLFGAYEKVYEFLAFLCKACYSSFFFAHRIVWFLKSLENSVYKEK